MRVLKLVALFFGSLAVLSLTSPLLWWLGRTPRREALEELGVDDSGVDVDVSN